MGATEEQMLLVSSSHVDGVSYVLIMYSVASLMFLFSNMLIHLYDRLANPSETIKSLASTHNVANGRAVEEGRAREAEEFELEGLTSDDEDNETQRMIRRSEEGQSSDSPIHADKSNGNLLH